MSNLSADSFRVGPLFINIKFPVRLAQYFGLTLPWLAANWLFLTRRWDFGDYREVVGFLIITFWVTFILFTTLLGAVHLSRYIIFAMPMMVLVSVASGRWLWGLWSTHRKPTLRYAPRIAALGLAIALTAVFIAETNLRLKLDSQSSLWKSMQAPSERAALSDALFEELGRPEQLPVTIALQEVQIRYWLDDRFVVRSLDGRVDPVLLKHAAGDGINHIGYLRERQVDVLLDTPNYNRDPDLWSLQRLSELPPGASITHEGMTFSRLPINQAVPGNGQNESTRESRWFADVTAPTVLQSFMEDLILVDPSGAK